ncbi:ATP-dependent DNA helicase DinG [Paraferrimonas sp. SM1919]|uniref:ATP-dependent DNA helicase DinG n=1 Tax=Paraferrimonas sp. SM1919 TaxID=2662263 RepID=UPI0013D25528|nr:ATP-dependent DNA helicase DinG [Paraferrimonas sp. SM1919]
MLDEKVKTEIRTLYQAIAKNLPNFRSRREQNYMVAQISKTLAGEYDRQRRLITIEAATGIGKSFAYLLGTIPLALNQGKTVCISTATVALQEQLVNKDLPLVQEYCEKDFKYGLVKGRQRYVCLSKLEMMLGEQDGMQAALWQSKPDSAQVEQLQQLYKDYKSQQWDGDIDSLKEPINEHLWEQIASDKHSCQRQNPSHRHCPFHKARDLMDSWDVLVVNHSLLLADLDLGGGIILPEPESMYYVLDEAHHLPDVVRNYSSASTSLKATSDWLAKLDKTIVKVQNTVPTDKIIAPCQGLIDDANELSQYMMQLFSYCDMSGELFNNEEQRFRFPHGVVPDSLTILVENLTTTSNHCLKHLTKIQSMITEAVKDDELANHLAEPLLAENGYILQRVENLNKLWKMYNREDHPHAAPYARWLDKSTNTKNMEYLASASPIEVGFLLEDMLWSKAAGVVLCSATLRALGKFDHFCHQVGIKQNDGSQYLALASPFDFQNNAALVIPKMQFEPSNVADFTKELIKLLPNLIKDEQATLVLFSSYRQMEEVASGIRGKLEMPLLIQGEIPRQHLLAQHKKRCDNNQPSVIFGTSSLSEGLDLPGDYLTNLIITKLPFAVPTSPVEEAHSEYIKFKGGNPFMQLTVPDASRKLIQSCGRLLRNEDDYGKITILDKRLLTRRYGSALLNALPPYRRLFQ